MIILELIKNNLEKELKNAKSIWIASAMISNNGWSFIQKHITQSAIQHFLIGIDLATDPAVFESIFKEPQINARVYQTKYTFHPKVYLIQSSNYTYTAFIGSSNTTSGGLEKNVEINFQITDQSECKKLLNWFNLLYNDGYLISQEFINDYKSKFVKASVKKIEIEKEANNIKINLADDKGQYFSKNQHEIFNSRFHRIDKEELKKIRKEVKDKFLELHHQIYPRFTALGLQNLHAHHQPQELVSRHYFNAYSGNYISSMWMHFGKSSAQLQIYKGTKAQSFINNIRMQVIIHEQHLGVWLVLGKDHGSIEDRKYFRNEMMDPVKLIQFFRAFKKLGDEYWIGKSDDVYSKDIKSPSELIKIINKERLEDYFIIGCDIERLDKRLSKSSIANTILEEFKKLYPLYEIMRHR